MACMIPVRRIKRFNILTGEVDFYLNLFFFSTLFSLLRYRSRCYSITNLSQITWPWSVSGCLTGLERYRSLERLQLISYRILSHHQPVRFPFRRDLRFSCTLAIYCAPFSFIWGESQHRQRFISTRKSHMPDVALWSEKCNRSAILHIASYGVLLRFVGRQSVVRI